MKELFEKTEYPRNYVEFVRKYSYKYGVDENLIFAIIKAESGFDKNAESKAGAMPKFSNRLSLGNDMSSHRYTMPKGI